MRIKNIYYINNFLFIIFIKIKRERDNLVNEKWLLAESIVAIYVKMSVSNFDCY
jgi:hypothetical protein